MKKNKITFLILECIFLILTLFFAWKIFDRDVPEKRVAVILPESGDNRCNIGFAICNFSPHNCSPWTGA